jgi:hypothetical protein
MHWHWAEAEGLFGTRVLVDSLRAQDPGIGLIAVLAGLLLMFYGWRMPRLAVVLSAAVIGAGLGSFAAGMLSASPFFDLCLIVAGSVCLAALSCLSLRVSVAVLGGLLAMYAVISFVGWLDLPRGLIAIAATATALLVASLTFIFLEQVVMFVTSLEGAMLLVAGCLVLMSSVHPAGVALGRLWLRHPVFMPLTLVAPTVIGFFLQLAEFQQRSTAKAVT